MQLKSVFSSAMRLALVDGDYVSSYLSAESALTWKTIERRDMCLLVGAWQCLACADTGYEISILDPTDR